MIEQLFTLLFLLFVVHWVCDYPLQGDFLSKAKKSGPLANYHLVAHSGIQAGGVYLVTGSLVLALIEWFFHTLIDHAKNEDMISFETDQILHLLCKVVYVVIILISGYVANSPVF